MLIRHSLEVTEKECTDIFNEISSILLNTYVSKAQQDEAITNAETLLLTRLNTLANKAFSIGKHIGEAKADEKDLGMY